MKIIILIIWILGVCIPNLSNGQSVYTFKGTGNWSEVHNWANDSIPPPVLLSGSQIIINPVDSGECVLDVFQTISSGAILTVKPGKKFRILGNFSINKPLEHADSSSIVMSITKSTGGVTYFTYDSVNRRYTNWYYYHDPYYYDSTFVFYNNDGQISALVDKKPTGGWPYAKAQVTVFSYTATGRLSKIYLKLSEDLYSYTPTFNTDISNIESYDSLDYDANGLLRASYKFKYMPSQLFSYNYFSFDPSNDSLLQKVEYYASNSMGGHYLSNSILFSKYDNNPNPFYKLLKNYGLFPMVQVFYVLPEYFIPSYIGSFATYSPHNCTQAGYNIKYIYNSELFPVRCDIGEYPTGDWVYFTYRKFRN